MKRLKQKTAAVITAAAMLGIYTTAFAGSTVTIDKYISAPAGTFAMNPSTTAPFNGAYADEKDGEPCIKVEYAIPGDGGRTGNTNGGIQVFNLGTNTASYKRGIIKIKLKILHEGDTTGSDCVATSLGFVGADGTQVTQYGGRIYGSKISSVSNKELNDENGQYYSIGSDWADVAFIVNTEKGTESLYLNNSAIQEEADIGADISAGCKVWYWATFGKPKASYSYYWLKDYVFTNYDSAADIEIAIADAEREMTQTDIDVARMVVAEFAEEDKAAGYYERIEELQNVLYSSSELSSLSTAVGELSPAFSPNVKEYTVTVPYGTENVPEISAKPLSPSADVEIIPAESLDGQTNIIVTSKDKSSVSAYTISYVIAKNTDAGIQSVSANNAVFTPEFNMDITEYYINLPYKTESAPKLDIVMNDSSALYSIIYPDGIGDITVNTTADNGVDTKEYIFHMNIMPPFTISDINIWGEENTNVSAKITKDSGYTESYDIAVVLHSEMDGHTVPGKMVIKQYDKDQEPENPFSVEFEGTAAEGQTADIYAIIPEELEKSEIMTVSVDEPVIDHGKEFTVSADGLSAKSVRIKIYDEQGELRYLTESDAVNNEFEKTFIMPDEDIWSNGIYRITAECGGEYAETTVDLRPFSSDTYVKSIKPSEGVLRSGAEPDSFDIVLPYGTVSVPKTEIELADKNAEFTLEPCEKAPGTAVLLVTAEDNSQKTYNINYVWDTNCAYLKELSIEGGTMLQSFSKTVYSYSVQVPSGTRAMPKVIAEAEDPAAKVTVNAAGSVPGKVSVSVTSADGTATAVYTLNVSVKSSYSGGSGGSSGGGSSVGTKTVLNIVEKTADNPEDNVTQDMEEKGAFYDIKGHWAENDILYMHEKGYINGKSDKNFDPDAIVTRAEFCALAVRSLGLERKNAETKFDDISDSDWYSNDVYTAASNGLVNGYNGVFRPNDAITREEMAYIVYNAYLINGSAVSDTQKTGFSDEESISGWAAGAVAAVKELELIFGISENEFAPKQNSTRAEAVVILKRLLNKNI